MTPQQRVKQLGRIHAAKRELGLADEAYRSLLESLTGRDSCKGMNDRQLNHVLDWLNWMSGRRKAQPMVHGRFTGETAKVNLVHLCYALSRITPPGYESNPLRSMAWRERTAGRCAAFFEAFDSQELWKLIEGVKAIWTRSGARCKAGLDVCDLRGCRFVDRCGRTGSRMAHAILGGERGADHVA